MKKGINRIQHASDTCDIDVNRVAFDAPNEVANSGSAIKLVMNGPAYALVTFTHMPISMENMKNTTICLFRNIPRALKPNLSANGILRRFHHILLFQR